MSLFCFSNRVCDFWNALPSYVIEEHSLCKFRSLLKLQNERLKKFLKGRRTWGDSFHLLRSVLLGAYFDILFVFCFIVIMYGFISKLLCLLFCYENKINVIVVIIVVVLKLKLINMILFERIFLTLRVIKLGMIRFVCSWRDLDLTLGLAA